jgi:glycosyltransferase involved in cell wall biosynthesis
MNPDKKSVSIIIPCYNYGRYISDTIKSVQAQSHHNWECIIVDDGSTDNTIDIVAAFAAADSRIILRQQKNQGPSAARNLGLKISRGDFIAFLDADDLFHKDKLNSHLQHFALTPEIDISYGNCLYFSAEKPGELFANIELTRTEWMPRITGCGYDILPKLVAGNIFPICAPVFRRSIFKQSAAFETSLKNLEDWSLWFSAACNNAVFSYLADEKCVSYIRVHKDSLSQQRNTMYLYEFKFRKHVIPAYLQCVHNPDVYQECFTLNQNIRFALVLGLMRRFGSLSPRMITLYLQEGPRTTVRYFLRYFKNSRRRISL